MIALPRESVSHHHVLQNTRGIWWVGKAPPPHCARAHAYTPTYTSADSPSFLARGGSDGKRNACIHVEMMRIDAMSVCCRLASSGLPHPTDRSIVIASSRQRFGDSAIVMIALLHGDSIAIGDSARQLPGTTEELIASILISTWVQSSPRIQ